ncbi:MAG: radical SAM protein [Saprospiraceae bacterium]
MEVLTMQRKSTAIKTAPVLSAEIFIIPLEKGSYIVYAPLRQAAFVGNTQVVNFLADLQRGVYNDTVDKDGSLEEFLRNLEILDAGEENLPITVFSGDPEPTSVTLFLTTACNLRCTYCYASAGDTPLRHMNIEVAKKGINFVMANALKKGEKNIEIAYHGGGEPTVNWKIMTESLAYAKDKAGELGLQVSAASASNGVLSDRQIDWVVQNLNGVSLSYDGLPEVQDKHRITASGKGSSDKVLHTMRRFDEAGFAYGIRMTVTDDLIAHLPASIEFICSQFKPQRIQVEPAYQMGRWREAPSAESQAFIEAYREASCIAKSHNQEITFSGARLGLLTNHFCGITQDSFCLSPDGNVSACYEVFSEDAEWSDTFFYGKPVLGKDDYSFNLPVLNKLRQQAIQHRDFCRGCYAKWSCGGDCYHKSLTVNGSDEFQGTDRCHIIREFTKDQILERIVQSGGLFWHEPPNAFRQSSSGKELLFS